MIVNLRGTSGSGKTTALRTLMARAEACGHTRQAYLSSVDQKKPKPLGYAFVGTPPLYVLGSYETVCGGCDTLKTQDQVCGLVRHFAPYGHVVFEGLLISHLYSRYEALNHELAAHGYVWAFLDTPLELCLARVQQRRDARGKAKHEFNPHNTVQKWHDMRRVYARCQEAGLDARWVAHETAGETVWAWLTT